MYFRIPICIFVIIVITHFFGCESNYNDSTNVIVNNNIDTLTEFDSKKVELKANIEVEEKKEEVLTPEINSSAPTILKSARKNSLFDSQKWLDSDRSKYMALHPGRVSEYDKLIKKFARRYGFDWRLIAAQIYAESNFKNDAKSHVGASGLMQIMPATAKFMGYSAEKMIKPEVNIMVGCMYDQRMYNLWGRQTKNEEQRLAFALASYNAGRGRVLKSYDTKSGKTTWNLVHPELPHETQSYVHKIFLKYQYYKKKALP